MRTYILLIVLSLISLHASAQKLSGVVKGGGPTAIVLEPVPAKTFPPSNQTVTMDQRGLKFAPPLLVIQQGTAVDFKNSDSVSHNVFWPNISGNKKLGHNLGTAPSGQALRFKFDNPGNIPVLCNMHTEMSADIVVSPTPYFTQTDAAGAYSINNLPEGAYKATAWHNGKATTITVTVKGDTKLDF